jgi:sporulation protein YlmC with PRC-barrel domain
MAVIAGSALLSALLTTGNPLQASVPLQYRCAGCGVPRLVWVHHENADNAPPAQLLKALPADDWPVTKWYKQTVYDLQGNKLGEIADWLVDHDGRKTATLIGVGGLLGAGEKYVAVPFDAIHFKKKDNAWYPVMNTTKDALKSATGYRYDRNIQSWQPEATSVGGGKGK